MRTILFWETYEEATALNLQPHLIGKLVELRPLRADDWPELFAVASDPLIWAQHPAPDRHLESEFRAFFAGALESGGAFAIIERASGAIIGSTRYHGYDPDQREVEIGWTFLARPFWGGRYNGEVKRLMLDHAFGCVDRVVFIVGEHNIRSQRAVERLGARRRGLLHKLDSKGRPLTCIAVVIEKPGA